jgi:hypothetical protein
MHVTESSILAVRPICGGSDPDSPLIVELIAKASMCLPCAASKMGISETRAAEAIERIRSFMVVTVETARCAGCLCVTTTYRVADERAPANVVAPPTAPPTTPTALPATPTLNEALWRFLAERRGKMFCTQCIANALFATKRIDRAMLGAEGRGARRQYGTCASCGKERLLCGLAS